MNQIVIPIESLRRIDSWLFKAIGFTADMFIEDIEEILYRYEDKLNFPKDYSLYVAKDKSVYKKECPFDNDFDTQYKFALEVGNNLIIKLAYKKKNKKGEWEDAITQSEEGIRKIWNTHITSPTKEDEDIYNALLILAAIYYKYKTTKGFFGMPPFIAAIPGVNGRYQYIVNKPVGGINSLLRCLKISCTYY